MATFEGSRLLVAGLAGDSGKTLVSLGLTGALRDRGLVVRPFKKGPDYIDAAWLSLAAGLPCRNLDTFLMTAGAIAASRGGAASTSLCLVEGNRGLFDGVTAAGEHSSAELAKRFGLPVVLVVDVTKVTRTAAAMVLGCRALDPALDLAGVVLNRVATARQERLVRTAVETDAGVPVIGAIPRVPGDDPLPCRHLGLVTPGDHRAAAQAVATATGLVRDHVDLDRILAIAATAGPLRMAPDLPPPTASRARVGYFFDRIFSFYYPENLERLEAGGAELVPLSPIECSELPADLDGLYIGGGFPETHVDELAGNQGLGASLRARVDEGLPIFAECGGLMYLARELVVGGTGRKMAGVLDLRVVQEGRPQGHGYVEAEVDVANPFYPHGARLRGHEFHFSRVEGGADVGRATLAIRRGSGLGAARRDGLVKGRVWASYLHQHALGSPGWADGFLTLAKTRADERAAARSATG